MNSMNPLEAVVPQFFLKYSVINPAMLLAFISSRRYAAFVNPPENTDDLPVGDVKIPLEFDTDCSNYCNYSAY